MFDLVGNRIFASADDSNLLADVRKPADRPAVARIREWRNHWYMILNPIKTKALVVSKSRTVTHPHDDLVLSGVSIRAGPNLDILIMKFDSRLTFQDPCLSVNWYFEVGETYICGHLCVTTLLFCICSPIDLSINGLRTQRTPTPYKIKVN